MLIGARTLLPVCVGLLIENTTLAKGRGHFFPPWTLPLNGFFGALPDLCTPHLSLEARYTSWLSTLVASRGFGIGQSTIAATLYLLTTGRRSGL